MKPAAPPAPDSRRQFLVSREEWETALGRGGALDAYRTRPVAGWPYVWGVKEPGGLLRWYDYAMGRITGESAEGGKVRCTLLILGCTGEIKNPVAYDRLRAEFFSELLEQSVAAGLPARRPRRRAPSKAAKK